MTRLATLSQGSKPDQALSVLDQPFTLDPYNEELYGRIMRLPTGRGDAASWTLRLLEIPTRQDRRSTI
jgi:hypothetical protein